MTKSEFQELLTRTASSGTTLKDFLRLEGVAYSTCNFWSKKLKSESEPLRKHPIKYTNRVGGKRSSFLPTFVFRPLIPPYMRFRIRQLLFWIPFEKRILQTGVACLSKVSCRNCNLHGW